MDWPILLHVAAVFVCPHPRASQTLNKYLNYRWPLLSATFTYYRTVFSNHSRFGLKRSDRVEPTYRFSYKMYANTELLAFLSPKIKKNVIFCAWPRKIYCASYSFRNRCKHFFCDHFILLLCSCGSNVFSHRKINQNPKYVFSHLNIYS